MLFFLLITLDFICTTVHNEVLMSAKVKASNGEKTLHVKSKRKSHFQNEMTRQSDRGESNEGNVHHM